MSQLELDLPTPKKRGGKRPGAGRPARGPRSSERHQVRPRLTMHVPVHVTVRIAKRVGSLRRRKIWFALRRAAVLARSNGRVRIVDVSVQHSHVHMVCEADSRMDLARGMQGFLISAAKRINRACGAAGGGVVFADRYHARQMTSRLDVRNTRNYVINNWRHHDDARPFEECAWDPYSSAIAFDGWADFDATAARAQAPPVYQPWPSAIARSWLLREGWRTHGLISCWESPRS